MARREYQDPPLHVHQTAHGPAYYIRYRVKRLGEDGKIARPMKWHTIGLCAEMTEKQAMRERAKILAGVNGQVFTVQSQMRWPAFVALFDANHIARLAVPTQNNYRQQLKNHITPVWEKAKICDIGPLQVDQLFTILEAAGIAKTTRNTIRGVLGAAFKCARKWKLLTDNPMTAVNIGGGARRVRECRVPSLEDVQRLMSECDGDVPLLIETLYTTGMRISEAAGLVVGDLDFDRGMANVRRRNCRGDIGQTKSDAGTRGLPLGGVLDSLRSHVASKAPMHPVFTHQGEPIVDNTLLANYLTPRMVRLGIKFPGFGWHTFRRLHLSLMQTRLTLFDLRKQAGHADVRTTQRYIVDDAARRAEAARDLPRLRPEGPVQ